MPEKQSFTGFLSHHEKKHTPREVLWDRFRAAWKQNEDFRNSYAANGSQPLPLKAIEQYEERKNLEQ